MNETSTAVTGRVRLAAPGPRPSSGPVPRRWWRDVAGALTVLSVVVVTALWTANGGFRNLQGVGEPATTLGRLAGLVASTAWTLVVTYPGMVLATAGTGLLILIVVLSVRAARRRLRYESWHLLHLYAYLGVGLALPHQIWTGADFAGSALARLYWWGLYAATLGAVVAFRVALPLGRSAYHRLRVEQVVAEAPGVVSVYLRGHRLDRLPVRAGQFFLWRFLDGPGWSRAHPYTLSAGPAADLLRITVKDLGDGSHRARALRPGTRVLVEGPYGALRAAGVPDDLIHSEEFAW